MTCRQFQGKKILLGTQSEGKIHEFSELLKPFHVEVISLKNTDIEEPEETATTFIENALLKAHYYAQALNIPTLADDSGLCIEALDQKPGLYTKRFIEELGGSDKAFKKLAKMLEGKSRTATMHCALALAWPDGHAEYFEGICPGQLVFPARHATSGQQSFGVDPIFLPEGSDKTFSEDSENKQKISHRKRAIDLLFESCIRP